MESDPLNDKRRLKYHTQPKAFADKVLDKKRDTASGESADAAGAEKPTPENGPDSSVSDATTSAAEQVSTEGVATEQKPPAPQDNAPVEHAKPKERGYRANPISGEDQALTKVWMETENDVEEGDLEGKEDAEAKTAYEAAFKANSDKFRHYKHHHFSGKWSTYSEDKDDGKKDEEWFIPSPPNLEESDPEYLCAMCRQIDFAVLLTQRGVTGNNEPGPCVIELPALPGALEQSNCSFCTLLRRSLESRCTPDQLRAQASKEERDQRMRLTPLDDGPDYALRLEVDLGDAVPRVVVQMLASEESALPLQGQLVSPDTADMGRLSSWIQTCEDHHDDEGPTSPVVPVSSESSTLRVIDVQEKRVVSVTSPCRYACLSYVWGNQTGTQLTAESRGILEAVGGLSHESIHLGQTLQDAIKVTRDIGLPYLWIDALCIIQDDEEDKSDIISRMGAIYGNAIVTIVAATNTTPSDGLPGVSAVPRSQAQVVQKMQGITLTAAFHDARLPYHELEKSVWNSRAWTFQERQLSRRSVYFTNSQMHFRCPHEVVFEDTVPGLLTDKRPTELVDHSKFHGKIYALMNNIWSDPTQTRFPNKTFYIHGLGSESVSMMASDTTIPAPIYRAEPVPAHRDGTLRIEGETIWKAYTDAVNMYTQRKMSRQTDALLAFYGVGDLVAQGVNTAFWHGLPEFNFDAALLWYPREPLTRRTHEGASPSWSWAAWEGHTSYRGRGWYNAITRHPVNVAKWYQYKSQRDLIYEFIVKDPKPSPSEIADYAFRTARQPAVVRLVDPSVLYHLKKNDGWIVHRDTDRNEHYYTHEAYPSLRFTYPASLPSESLIPRASPSGTLYFVARHVPAHLINISSTKHDPIAHTDPFLQICLDTSETRREWEHIIYHQGYRAGFLARHAELSPDKKYALVAMSRDTIPSIAPPLGGWDAYWDLNPRLAQYYGIYEWDWGEENERMTELGPFDRDEPYRGWGYENGDPKWDAVRFGGPFMFDVYNVLLVEWKEGEDGGWWERVGVGKVNVFAFGHAKPEEGMIMLA